MRLELSDSDPAAATADLVCIGIHEGDDLPSWLASAAGAGVVRRGY
jgi:hypothetical protein